MSRITEFQTNFTAGEISEELHARNDIKYYYNGAAKLRNVFVKPQGGVRRRDGTRYLDIVPDDASGNPSNTKLIGFEFSTIQRYMILFYHEGCKIYRDGILQATVVMPYTSDDVGKIYTTQSLDTLLICHPDYSPRQLQRQGSHTSWAVSEWPLFNIPKKAFPGGVYTGVDEVQEIKALGTFVNDSTTYVLIVDGETTANIVWTATAATNATRMQDAIRALSVTSADGVTVSESGGVYTVTFADDDGDQYWGEIGWDIVGSVNGTEQFSVSVVTKGDNGGEDVWSSDRGWPVTCLFHQGRLFFGGSRELPNTVWFSRSGDFSDFSITEVLDDFGGEFTISSDDVAAIYAIFGGRHLQFFTQSSEFYVPKSDTEAITPSNFSLRRTTFRGCKDGLKVIGVDGATIFIQRGGKGLRELIFSDVEQAYQANDISFLASHLIKDPVAMDYRKATTTEEADYILMVNTDGTMTVFCTLRTQEINAFTMQETDGLFTDIGVSLDEVYVVVERVVDGVTVRYFEILDQDLRVDAAIIDDEVTGSPTTISGLDHLDGETVRVYTDGYKRADAVVSGGEITVADPIEISYQVGLAFPDVSGGAGYEVYLETLDPAPSLPEGAIIGKKRRIVEVTARLVDTGEIIIQNERVRLKKYGSDLLDKPAENFSGDYTVGPILGWDKSGRVKLGDNIGAKMQVLGLGYKLGV